MSVYISALLCVFGLVIGQLLFKTSAISMSETGSLFNGKALVPLIFAMLLYGVTSITWVWILQKVELGRVYPIMALAFVLVPVGSYLVFGERFHVQYIFGVILIVCGIAVITRG